MDVLRSEVQRQKAEYAHLAHELDAVTHHRTVLRDTIEQMDKQLRLKIDEVAAMRFPSESQSVDGGAGVADDEALRRQVQRLKARAAAVDELASTYRVSVLALYADGASYGAAQFGWQAHGLPQEFNSRGVHLIGVGWIEREINTVRHSYEDEVRLLDAEVGELRAKLRQNHSYIAELRRRFEDNMKAIFRTGKGQSQDGGMQQFDQLRLALEASDAEIHSLQQELGSEKTRGRHRHVQLVDDLTRTLQARDAALSALHRLEKFCSERGVDIKGLAIYEVNFYYACQFDD
jgi:chromosome segregation ATPase